MSIFRMHESIIGEYRKYVQSFLSISDERVRGYIEDEILNKNTLWPDPMIQLNPSYAMAGTVEELAKNGSLHRTTAEIFRTQNGKPIQLFRHQQDAIEKALSHQHFIVTSGTGSGKSLTYFIPIFDAVLRGNAEQAKVWAIVVYPMNALVNSQYIALDDFAKNYKTRTGMELPVRFDKYTGQEGQAQKQRIQQNPPHILLTNYVMLELALVRPEEHHFVDRATTALQFLVVDEVHTHRGRQGADVAMLIRRLRQRCGNPELLCIGTSATMVSGKATTALERRKDVSDYGSKLFGVTVLPDNVIEETLKRITTLREIPSAEELKRAIQTPVPQTLGQMTESALAAWIELTFGLEQDSEGHFRRKTPISFMDGAQKLSEITGVEIQACKDKLHEIFLKGIELKTQDGNPFFAFKLHQFITQGRKIYSTMEAKSKRHLTLDGQYYAPADNGAKRILFPLLFCRVCGQDYYVVQKDEGGNCFLPSDESQTTVDEELLSGYFTLLSEDAEREWSVEHLPPEWMDRNGRIKRDYNAHIPKALWASPDGSFSSSEKTDAVKGWFQPEPFLLCLNCGEFYTRRESEFRKLTGLSSEGRSTATTILSLSALQHAPQGGINEEARKILSFTDNRQDASLQAGHFNDFVQVSLLRSAIYAAIKEHKELKFNDAADKVTSLMNLTLVHVSRNPDLQAGTPQGKEVWKTFRGLIEYRIYEDLRRGWRVVQPNLEQCGILSVEYAGLDALCNDDTAWDGCRLFKDVTAENRKKVLTTVLDHFRRKFAIHVDCLKEVQQQQLKKRVSQHINAQWAFEENDKLTQASRFLLPEQENRLINTLSLSAGSHIHRYLKRFIPFSNTRAYTDFIQGFITVLCAHGFLIRNRERNTEFVQLDASVLLWKETDRAPMPDPIYSRQVQSQIYAQIQHQANVFFREFYTETARLFYGTEGREHTAQISYERREEREKKFREGKLKCLFCSPTMELGIDISDLQLVHLRDVPPTPANYAQRSGRAGRKGDPALVLTYCAARSGHDQYFFHHRSDMVAGSVRPPRIDLSNEDLIKAHVHAVWLANVRVPLGSSIADILELALEGYPLKENVKAQIQLSDARLRECLGEVKEVLQSCNKDFLSGGWYSDEWLSDVLRRAPDEFNKAFNRFRELYKAADRQWEEANNILRFRTRDANERRDAETQRREAERQKDLLCNYGNRDESDFYIYRYLASEGFLPGYNFPRLPLRAYIPRGNDGEYVARPRFLALTEFGPDNIIYHEGTKYKTYKLISPPGGLEERKLRAKLCDTCGYFNKDVTVDLCEHCGTRMDGNNSKVVSLLEAANVKTRQRDRITCDEEERRRSGYEITSHFRFALSQERNRGILKGTVYDANNAPLLHLVYAPAANLYRVNHGWRSRQEKGFHVDMQTGEWGNRPEGNEEETPQAVSGQVEVVRFFVQDTMNILLVYFASENGARNEELLATFQHALKKGIEQTFQIEEMELATERIGAGARRGILFWEASEGGAGVLRRLVEERDAMAQVSFSALERCHFHTEAMEDLKTDCVQACYECLLSYANQRDHAILNRHLVKDFLSQLSKSATHPQQAGRNYEEHYQWLRSLTDSRSDLERKFLDELYRTKRNLPHEAQKALADYHSIPDFFYDPNVCVFCDGSVHDEPSQHAQDERVRAELREKGYRVIVIRYDEDLEEKMIEHKDICGEGRT